MILKGLVNHQIESNSRGRECIDALADSLPDTYEYFRVLLRNASIRDLQKCVSEVKVVTRSYPETIRNMFQICLSFM